MAPAGLLRPLRIPYHPYSYIVPDFVTGLPTSNGHTLFHSPAKTSICQKSHRTYNSSRFQALGIPKHIVYNRGPFCRLVGAAPNLFSEFHSSATARQKTAEKNCPGWSTPITPKFHHLLVCIPSSDAWGINRPCFCLRRLAFHLPKVSAIIAERSGCKLQWLYNGSAKVTRDKLTAGAPRQVQSGTKVMLSIQDSHKLSPHYIGPFTITKIVKPSTVKLLLPSTMRRINPSVFRVPVTPSGLMLINIYQVNIWLL